MTGVQTCALPISPATKISHFTVLSGSLGGAAFTAKGVNKENRLENKLENKLELIVTVAIARFII